MALIGIELAASHVPSPTRETMALIGIELAASHVPSPLRETMADESPWQAVPLR